MSEQSASLNYTTIRALLITFWFLLFIFWCYRRRCSSFCCLLLYITCGSFFFFSSSFDSLRKYFSIVRLLKQKWHNTSQLSTRRGYFYTAKSTYSLSCSSSPLNRLASTANKSSLMKRLRHYLLPYCRQQQATTTQVNYSSVSRSASSSASSSPLVLFTRTPQCPAPAAECGVVSASDTNNKVPVEQQQQPGHAGVNSFSYYSTSFTNSIRSKLTSLRNNFLAYKGWRKILHIFYSVIGCVFLIAVFGCWF
jgi:hypothetical protein